MSAVPSVYRYTHLFIWKFYWRACWFPCNLVVEVLDSFSMVTRFRVVYKLIILAWYSFCNQWIHYMLLLYLLLVYHALILHLVLSLVPPMSLINNTFFLSSDSPVYIYLITETEDKNILDKNRKTSSLKYFCNFWELKKRNTFQHFLTKKKQQKHMIRETEL